MRVRPKWSGQEQRLRKAPLVQSDSKQCNPLRCSAVLQQERGPVKLANAPQKEARIWERDDAKQVSVVTSILCADGGVARLELADNLGDAAFIDLVELDHKELRKQPRTWILSLILRWIVDNNEGLQFDRHSARQSTGPSGPAGGRGPSGPLELCPLTWLTEGKAG